MIRDLSHMTEFIVGTTGRLLQLIRSLSCHTLPTSGAEQQPNIYASVGASCSEKTLAKLACIGGGPIYRLFGRIPPYLNVDLDAYAEAKLSKPVRSTSEYGGGR
jgi:hypothetical protein